MITAKRIRYLIDVGSTAGPTNYLTGEPGQVWRGNDLRLELAFIFGASATALESLTQVSSITVQWKDDIGDEAALFERTIPAAEFVGGCTKSQFEAGTSQQVTVDVTGDETNLAPDDGQTTRTLWMTITAVTTHSPGKNVTLACGAFVIAEDGYLTPGTAPVEDYYNKGEADAKFMPISTPGAGWRWYSGAWYVYSAGSGLWHRAGAVYEGGQVALALVQEGISL